MDKTYSGKQVIKAGEKLLHDDIFKKENEEEFYKAMDILSYWRFSHVPPLANAAKLLQTITIEKDKHAIFAMRLKRYVSIVVKLRRFKQMKLKNMQDIGGCRAIVSNPKKLQQVLRELKKRPEFRDRKGKLRFKDYLKNPKADGYRSYHLVGHFLDEQKKKKSIEIQIRTRLQHDWATALEIVDLFTGQALKSNIGEESWKNFFKATSEQFAIMEQIHLFDTMDKEHKKAAFIKKLNALNDYSACHKTSNLERKLEVVKKLEAFAQSIELAGSELEADPTEGYVLIVINTQEYTLDLKIYDSDNNEDAEEDYIASEKHAAQTRDIVVALVSTTALGGIKEAYPNYFADSGDFLEHLMLIMEASLAQKKKARGFWK